MDHRSCAAKVTLHHSRTPGDVWRWKVSRKVCIIYTPTLCVRCVRGGEELWFNSQALPREEPFFRFNLSSTERELRGHSPHCSGSSTGWPRPGPAITEEHTHHQIRCALVFTEEDSVTWLTYVIVLDSNIFLHFTELVSCIGTYETLSKCKPHAEKSKESRISTRSAVFISTNPVEYISESTVNNYPALRYSSSAPPDLNLQPLGSQPSCLIIQHHHTFCISFLHSIMGNVVNREDIHTLPERIRKPDQKKFWYPPRIGWETWRWRSALRTEGWAGG